VALKAVRRDADHLRAGVRERAAERVEALRLERAAADVVLGIEIQHDLAPFESREADGLAGGRGEGEIGRRIAGLEWHAAFLSTDFHILRSHQRSVGNPVARFRSRRVRFPPGGWTMMPLRPAAIGP
jgi:hypothetical protein